MKSSGVLIALSAIWTVCTSQIRTSPAVPEYRRECVVWNNATLMLSHQKGTKMSCRRNPQCTGSDCSGVYQYQGPYSMNNLVQLDYCFGVAIHPCNIPVNLHIYLDMTTPPIHYQQSVSNTTDVKIPGLHYEMGELGQVDGYISVHFEKALVNGHRYVIIGMTFKVRVQGTLAAVGEWPESMQQTLMPLTEVPVPDCDHNVLTPPHNPANCHKYVPPSTLSPTSQSITTETPSPTRSASNFTYASQTTMTKVSTPLPTKGPTRGASHFTHASQTTTAKVSTPSPTKGGKACTPNKHGECPHNMRCRLSTLRCYCPYLYNGTHCIREDYHPPAPTTPFLIIDPVGTLQPGGFHGENPKQRNVIIGVSVACVALVIVVVGAILFIKYRNHQLRYGNHQPLINNEEEDDDDPIDVST